MTEKLVRTEYPRTEVVLKETLLDASLTGLIEGLIYVNDIPLHHVGLETVYTTLGIPAAAFLLRMSDRIRRPKKESILSHWQARRDVFAAGASTAASALVVADGFFSNNSELVNYNIGGVGLSALVWGALAINSIGHRVMSGLRREGYLYQPEVDSFVLGPKPSVFQSLTKTVRSKLPL